MLPLLHMLPLAVGVHQMWYALPLVVAVSLVYAATRHEYIRPILMHSIRFAAWIVTFMVVVLVILTTMSWLA